MVKCGSVVAKTRKKLKVVYLLLMRRRKMMRTKKVTKKNFRKNVSVANSKAI